jgi:putative hydrolase of the HAD superfamily
MSRFAVIAFDADDTLWHNERLYEKTQNGLVALLENYGVARSSLVECLYRTEGRNIRVFGYGVKSFALSMIETAVELTEARISGTDIRRIIDLAKAQLNAPIDLLEHVRETVSSLADRYHLMVITKGDLFDQENKIARSGLGDCFHDIEVVSEKTAASYANLFRNHALDPESVLMVGNSLRSDILPVLDLGASAVYVPYELTWEHEAADVPPPGTLGFYQLDNLSQLPALLDRLESQP